MIALFCFVFYGLAQVQGTNDSSVVSKVSAAAQGYFQDVFLQHFVCKVTRRAPLINRSARAILYFNFIEHTKYTHRSLSLKVV